MKQTAYHRQHQQVGLATPLESPTMPHVKHPSWPLTVSLLINLFLVGAVAILSVSSESSVPADNTDTNKLEVVTTEQITLNDRDEYACKLYTIREARELLGDNAYRSDWPGVLGTEYNGLDVSRCQYQAAYDGHPLSSTIKIQITQSKDISANLRTTFLEQMNGKQKGGEVTTESYWSPDSKTLDVLTDDQKYWIKIIHTNDPTSEAVPLDSVGAARTIIDRISYVVED